ncbi:MAG: hypothetical protein MUO88_19940 [Desulfobacterales bacterium]|nr:hypothetical protein [Desulfobacterales bacterium]
MMSDFIERLKREKAEAETETEAKAEEREDTEKEWLDTGKNDGREFVKNASYKDLQYALDWEIQKEARTSQIPSVVKPYIDPREDDFLGDYFSGIVEKYDQLKFERSETTDLININNYYIEWEAGWKEGVKEVWNEIKDKI